MSPEEKELLKRSIALGEENNDILRSIQRSMRLGRLMTALYWLFIIGSAAGAYYFAQPYIQQMLGVYGSAKSNLDSVNSFIDNLKVTSQ